MYAHLWRVDGEKGIVDREWIVGPVEGVQLTYNVLRETGSGEAIAHYDGSVWKRGSLWFSDVTFSEEYPDSIVGP